MELMSENSNWNTKRQLVEQWGEKLEQW